MNNLSGKRIAVLMGGPGSERQVSLFSAKGVAKALRERGAEVIEVDIPDHTVPPLGDVWVAFNVIHGTLGEDGELQRLLEAQGVRYTGEGVAGSELAFDKIKTKARLLASGVPTPAFEVIASTDRPTLPLPYVIKAPQQGSSVGVVIVKTEGEVAPGLREVAKYDDVFLIEEFAPGRELTVGVLGDLALPIIEILPKTGFYDFHNKYPFLDPQGHGAATHLCPAPLAPELAARIAERALAAHRALGLEVYSRVDFILRDDGEPLVLEVNTIPGMTEASLLPEAAGVAGIPYGELCERIIDLSLRRFDP